MPTDSSQMSKRLPKLAVAAATTAFLLAAFGLLSAWQQIILVFSSLVPLMAGIGILRKRVWSAYGFALFQLAQLAAIPLILLRSNSISRVQLAVLGGFNLAMSLLFFLTGRSLTAMGAKRGWITPWIVLACLFTLPFFFVQAFMVPTGAMEDTLLIGDRILVRVFPRIRPAYGDMVVFNYPIDRRQTFIKRVIGLPGDRIRMVSKRVYRNGSALTEPYAVHKFNAIDPYRDNLPIDLSQLVVQPDEHMMLVVKDMLQNHVLNGEVVVPPGKYFVLGDNRDNSLDSRYWGFLDASDIIGRPFLIYDSEAKSNEITKGKKNILRHQKRWNRLFRVL